MTVSLKRVLPLVEFAIMLLIAREAAAGMPAPLREDIETYFRLRETPHERFQAISFFLLGLLLSTCVVWGLWNFLARDFSRMPRLTFIKALAMVVLWGLLFVIVLTMISGARELMTPGAWKKEGVTYSVKEDSEENHTSDPDWTPKPFEREASSSDQKELQQ